MPSDGAQIQVCHFSPIRCRIVLVSQVGSKHETVVLFCFTQSLSRISEARAHYSPLGEVSSVYLSMLCGFKLGYVQCAASPSEIYGFVPLPVSS